MQTSTWRTSLATVALVLTVISCRSVDDFDRWTVPAQAPIAVVGHGAFIGADGQKVRPTPELVLSAQRYYLKQLYGRASPRAQEAFKLARSELLAQATSKSAAEEILLNAAQLSWLMQNAGLRNIEDVASINTALWSLVKPDAGAPSKSDAAFLVPRDIYARWLPHIMLKPLYSTPLGGPAYADECRRNGVPLPPDWGSPQWRGPTTLGTDFLGSTPIADMYVFENDQGMCAALPRHDGRTIALLGVICLGVQSSKSCYWDNQRNKLQFDIPVGSRFSIVNDFAGGADLRGGQGGQCTDCHAGENPYVVHPGEPAMAFARGLPAFWHQPLVHPLWLQNQGPGTTLNSVTLGSSDRSCLDCHKRPGAVQHRFPVVSNLMPGYCGTVLPNAFNRTMPSAGNAAPYKKHYDALQAACRQPPPGDGTVIVNGGLQADPTTTRVDTTGTLTSCAPGATDCPVGFCYWRSLHGPFWQTTRAGVPPEDSGFRGSFLRIFAEAGQWKWRAFSDPTGMAPSAPPGGVAECTVFNDLAGVTNGQASFGNPFAVTDPDGTRANQSVDATIGTAAENIYPLTGFIGNVAHYYDIEVPDRLRTREQAGRVALEHRHRLTPTGGYPVAPLTGESWTFGSPSWTPVYLAREVRSTGDVELVPAANAAKARCYLTGIEGDWSTTTRQGTLQPYADIYTAPSGEIRLRVWPNSGPSRVNAYASCIALR